MVSKPDFKRDFAILSRRENKSESGDQPGVRAALVVISIFRFTKNIFFC